MTETPQELIARLQEALADAEANINIKADFIDSAINMHAADSQRIHELEAALATARADALESVADHFNDMACACPVGHEHQGRGASSYNWIRHHEKKIRDFALIPATPPALS